MDQNKDLFGSNEKKKVARRRWAILAKALKSPVGSEPSSPTEEYSVRRISSFMLLRTQQLASVPILSQDSRINDQITKRTWYKYSIQIEHFEFSLKIGHRNRTFSAEDLMGFNNTGNICIWPSEETLSYYVCSNLKLFKDKRVLELGGGMSCLAGLFVAKFASPVSVTVTDGNKMSVENVQAALYCNEFDCPVNCKILKWGPVQGEQYDVILCADCLFFDDARNDLIECLWSCLHSKGIALIMAPKRGTTLEKFIAQSQLRGFLCKLVLNYNQVVWNKRLTLLNNCEADYWVSQTKKYCEFCKCWVTDNRPSIDFHEKGRRHQENVKKRLRNISRISSQVQKNTDKIDVTIKQMESAALEAYKKDVETNADLSYLSMRQSSSGVTKLWNEHRTRDGKSYYVNIMTKETVWRPPPEGFLSVEEQRELSLTQAQKQLKELEKHKKKEAVLMMEKVRQEEAEAEARKNREKLKARRVVDDLPPETCGPLLEPGKTDPYGKWQVVKENPVIDLQLPQQETYFEPPVEYEPEPVVKEFKEKTVESLKDDETQGESSFKKRKLNTGAKRNVRQRLDDD